MANNCIRRPLYVCVYRVLLKERKLCATDAIRDLSSSRQYNTHGRTVWSVVWPQNDCCPFPAARIEKEMERLVDRPASDEEERNI